MHYRLTMLAVGALLGFLSGLFGVGGSSIATPVLRLLDVPRLVALATPLPVTLPTAVVGGWTYWRRGLVDSRAVLWTATGGIPTVMLGSYMTMVVPGRLLMLLTGLFVTAVGARLLAKPLAAENKTEPSANSVWLLLGVGTGVGLLSGLLANGGGFLLVPAYLLLFDMGAQEAAATSLVTVAFMALPGTWIHWQLGHIDLSLALLLALGGLPFTYLGARTGLALSGRRARLLFGFFLLAFGVFFCARTLYRAELYGWLS